MPAAAAGQAGAPPADQATGRDAPVVRVACGAYEAVPTGLVGARFTRLLLQRQGRVMTTVTDHAVTSISCADATGDGEADLLARSFSGGAHCCETVRVWTLADKPRLLLEYAAGNAPGAALADLDGNGRAELVLGDDGLAYFDDLDYASSPSTVPLVACFEGEAFRDCTTEHPQPLRQAAARFRERLLPPAAAATPPGRTRGAALGLFAVSLLLGEEEQARRAIQEAAQDEKLLAWIERIAPRLRVWAEGRARKLRRPGS
jgi:hypothetical protein